jgi:hypothetical protein
MDMRDMMQKTIDTLAAENEALRRPPTERPYVCPCPDGCNGCEVPDFAIKEIERLTAQLNNAREIASKYEDRYFELRERVDELEFALRGYVKATTGQESATVTFPMALEGEQ